MSGESWFTPAALAALGLPDMPGTKKGVNEMADRLGWRAPALEHPANPDGTWRRREGRGGGIEYRAAVLPLRAKAALALRTMSAPANENDAGAAKAALSRGEAWARYERLPRSKKDEANRRLEALDAVAALERDGASRDLAVQLVAVSAKVSARTLYGWAALVAGVERVDRLPHLAPRHAGRQAEAECPEAAWEALKALYLAPERRTFDHCFREVTKLSASAGWTLPSPRTLERRLAAQVPEAVRILARDGVQALKRYYPAQERDHSMFHALEAVNADGHKWDVFVRWPGEEKPVRPVTVAFQDIRSGMILSWRHARSECTGTVLLALGDMVETWGVPDLCWLDNGRNFASKWLTGGTATRYRFKVKVDEPAGVMTQLGVRVVWTKPYSGQSKPIERAFRDWSTTIAKDPRFAGAWTGNTVANKPENYGAHAVPLELFEQVVAEGIAEHNTRLGRRSRVCGGKLSFSQAFLASYAEAPITRTTAEQRRLWLLAAEGLTVRSDTARLEMLGNRYWCDALVELHGQKVVARFDPAALHDGLHVYRLDGAYVAHAPCIEMAGFRTVDQGRAHERARQKWMRAQREQLDAMRRLSTDDLVAMLPPLEPPAPAPEPRVVRPIFGGNAAPKLNPETSTEEAIDQAFSRGVLRLVREREDD